MRNDHPSEPKVAGLILAAGLSRRMGTAKVLLPWRGRPLVRHLAEVALASRLEEVVVVTGHQVDATAAALVDLPVRLVHNPEFESGLASSLRAGVASIHDHADAVLIMLADQPLLGVELIDRLIEAFGETGARIVAPVAAGRRGNPVLFARALFGRLLEVRGDEGARAVIEAQRDQVHRIEVDSDIFEDIDTPEAYARLAASHGRE